MQYSLLTDTPRSRNTDPATSHRAAARIKSSGALGHQQRLVLDYVRQYPGRTSAELAWRVARDRDGDGALWPAYRPMLGRRLPELVPAHVRKGESRVCSVTDADSLTWWPRP